jgi:uncharacterized protein (TIGR02996 family)
MSVYDTDQWRAFIAAIRANPADDTPRLVAADWLNERGKSERAELIRSHVAWEAGDHGDGLRDRINGLFGRCQPRVFRSLKIDMTGTGYKWDRGFISEVYAPADWWLAHADTILAREPVAAVTLTTVPRAIDEPNGLRCELVGDPRAVRFNRAECWAATTEEESRPLLGLLRLRWPGVSFQIAATAHAVAG